MKKTTMCLAILMGAFLCMSTSGFALITFDTALMIQEPVQWYDASSGQFQMEALDDGSTVLTVNAGDLSVAGSFDYAYAFDGTVEITPSDKLALSGDNVQLSNQSGGVVSTITVKATKVYEKVSGDAIIESVDPVVLFEAQMVMTPWVILENGTDNTRYSGTTDYEMLSGEFVTGTVARMYDFQATYKLHGASPTDLDFSQDMESANPQITLTAPVPEPATMVLMGLGGLLLRRRK